MVRRPPSYPKLSKIEKIGVASTIALFAALSLWLFGWVTYLLFREVGAGSGFVLGGIRTFVCFARCFYLIVNELEREQGAPWPT